MTTPRTQAGQSAALYGHTEDCPAYSAFGCELEDIERCRCGVVKDILAIEAEATMTAPTDRPDPDTASVAALAEAFLNGIGDEWEQMYPFVSMTSDTAASVLAALTASGWTLTRGDRG